MTTLKMSSFLNQSKAARCDDATQLIRLSYSVFERNPLNEIHIHLASSLSSKYGGIGEVVNSVFHV